MGFYPFSGRRRKGSAATLLLAFLWLLGLATTSCGDLTVFVPPTSKKSVAEVQGVSLTAEGRISLAWASQLTSSKRTYDIYLLEVGSKDDYAFTAAAQHVAPLTYEVMPRSNDNTPRLKGKLLDSVQDLSFVASTLLDVDKTYAIQILDKTLPNAVGSKIVLVRIDFEPLLTGTASSQADSSTLVWNAVPGANRYEVYADAALTQKIGETTTNSLTISNTAVLVKDYYVKAYRGLLAAPGSARISLSNSSVKVVKVSTPSGHYQAGDVLDFAVEFSGKVSSFGDASLPLLTGSRTLRADLESGTGTTTLIYRYTVVAGDDTESLKNGAVLQGSYVDAYGLDVPTDLPAAGSGHSLVDTSAVGVDTVLPTSPLSVGFSTAYSMNGNVGVSWAASSDLHFLQHRFKLCSAQTCESGCGSEQTTAGVSETIVGLSEGTYYACVQGEDSFGNRSPYSSSLTPLRVDSTHPTVTKVYAQSLAGTYGLGTSVSVVVEWDEPVVVTGDLRLTLAAGATPHEALYVSGSGSNTLLFTYNVQTGDQTPDLDYSASSSLAFNGAGSLSDLAGNSAVLTLPAPASANSLAGQSAIALDGIVPTVSRAYAVTANGSYKAGDPLTIAVQFTEPVTLTDAAHLRLSLALGATPRYASYAAGDGTDTLRFTYTVQAGDGSADLDYASTTALAFNGAGTLRDQVGNPGTLTLPAPASANSLAGQSHLLIDAINPTVSRVYSTTADGIYGTGVDIDVTVEMSEPVTLTNPSNLRIQLETGATDRYAVYTSGSGTSALHFRYTIVVGDVAGDLNYLATSSLDFNGAGTAVDALSNPADLTLPALTDANSLSSQSSISIDTGDLKINKVYSVTADGTYTIGTVLDLAVEFNKVVTVTDGANLKLTLATGTFLHDADYDSGSGTDTLHFRYTVQSGDTSPDLNYHSNTSLSFHNGSSGSVKDSSNQAATLFLPSLASPDSLASRSDLVIDTLAPAVAKVYAVTADGAYKAGSALSLAVEFTESVTLVAGTGTMKLTLASGSTPRDATYSSQTNGKTLLFDYTVDAGDNTNDLDYAATTSLTKTGTLTLKDAAGNIADLTLPAPASADSLGGQSGIILDNTAPTVTRVYAQTSDGTYKVGTTLDLRVEFSEPVTLAAPSTMNLALATGTVHNATFSGGSGTSILEFSYPIQAGDTSSDLDYAATTSLNLTGGTTLKDAAGNNAVLTLPAPGAAHSLADQAALVIDTTAPTINRIFGATPDGSYTSPHDIDVTIEFSEPVTVNSVGNLRLALATGTTSQSATYVSGSGTNQITVRYAVQVGDESPDLNYVATTSLSFLSTGSIQDAVGNLSALVLPATGSANSLAGQSAIVIDAVAPLAPTITSPVDNSTVTAPLTAISGTSEANATITVYKDSVSQGTTTASAGGAWSYTFASPLLNGTYALAAKAADALGNVGPTATSHVTVAIPLATADAGADVVTNTTVTLFGATTLASSRQWSKVSGPGNLTFGSAASDSTTVSADTQGVYVLRLTATNAANVTTTDDMTFTWDTAAPTYTGITDIWQISSTSARIFWTAAYDDYTADNDITYELCVSSTPGSCATSFVASQTFASNVYDYTATGLTAGTVYDFLVRAVDKAGNISYGGGTLQSGGLRGVTQLAGGGQTMCALLVDQTVKCWGNNTYFQLGQGGTSTTNKNNPVTVTGLTGVKKIAVGIKHNCAIMSDDSLKCWGANTYGELGDGSTTNRSAPVVATAVSSVADVVIGDEDTCVLLKVTGNVQCFGHNNMGQLGDGTTTSNSSAVNVSGITGALQIAAGNEYNCARFSDKTMKCWGRNQYGQFGNNTTTNSSTPVTVSISNVESMDALETSTCAIQTGGAVSCWGHNNEGELGIGSLTDVSVPTALPTLTSGASQLVAGWGFVCAIMTDQTVKCWGQGLYGEMNNFDVSPAQTPQTIAGLTGISVMGAANDTACALLPTGSVTCWGRDDNGQVGDGTRDQINAPAKVSNLSGTPVHVEAGIDHSCALMSNKTIQCWGSNEWGMLGNGASIGSNVLVNATPQTVMGLSTVEVLRVGGYQSCAILTDKTVRCWGRNDKGQLGNNSTTDTSTPQTVLATSGSGPLTDAVDLILGYQTSCAILTGGGMVCWGAANGGMLGDGRSSANALIPVNSTKFTTAIKKGAAGYNHLCVILDDTNKTVQCIGTNSSRQLGDGTTNANTSAVTVLTGADQIDSFRDHTCVVLTDQTLKCWGANGSGQLGQGDFATYSVPKAVPGIAGVSALSVGDSFTCVVLSDHTVKCWGENDNSRLAYPRLTTNTNQNSPLAVTGLTGVAELGLGLAQTCALMQDATVKCWGYNNRGQTGVNRAEGSQALISTVVSKYTVGD